MLQSLLQSLCFELWHVLDQRLVLPFTAQKLLFDAFKCWAFTPTFAQVAHLLAQILLLRNLHKDSFVLEVCSRFTFHGNVVGLEGQFGWLRHRGRARGHRPGRSGPIPEHGLRLRLDLERHWVELRLLWGDFRFLLWHRFGFRRWLRFFRLPYICQVDLDRLLLHNLHFLLWLLNGLRRQ